MYFARINLRSSLVEDPGRQEMFFSIFYYLHNSFNDAVSPRKLQVVGNNERTLIALDDTNITKYGNMIV